MKSFPPPPSSTKRVRPVTPLPRPASGSTMRSTVLMSLLLSPDGGVGRPNSRWPNSAALSRSARPACGRESRQPAATSVAPCHSSQRQRRNGSRPGGSACSA